MRGLQKIRLSIGARFRAILIVTVIVIGGGGFWIGHTLIGRVFALLDDTELTESLRQGQEGWRRVHRDRTEFAERVLHACIRERRWPACSFQGLPIIIEESGKGLSASSGIVWSSEQSLSIKGVQEDARLRFGWDKVRPRVDTLNGVMTTREHLKVLAPQLLSSFSIVFGVWLFVIALSAFVVMTMMSRRIGRRMESLVEMARDIGLGRSDPAKYAVVLPKNEDEIGILTTAMHQMLHDLDEARTKIVLAEKMSAWQVLARKVAHEIKNPLTPISLMADEIECYANDVIPPLQDKVRYASHVIQDECRALTRMVAEFSAFARLPEPNMQPEDLGQVIRDFVARNERTDGITFSIEGAGPSYPVSVDRLMLNQILHNIVNNAIDASFPKVVAFRFVLETGDDAVGLSMVDDGPGIADNLKERIFEPHVSGKNTHGRSKGMGLGLAISRQIADDHGGTLELESTGIAGTCFRLELPRATVNLNG